MVLVSHCWTIVSVTADQQCSWGGMGGGTGQEEGRSSPGKGVGLEMALPHDAASPAFCVKLVLGKLAGEIAGSIAGSVAFLQERGQIRQCRIRLLKLSTDSWKLHLEVK